ncbi:hypothetical protein CAEBREN_29183 [Caenorhabditis brenneri]|uniref:Uncharacterized protein n=1 Tax=Caenorhabditis brenneri TaxID=135651 RepID=G0MZ88_CAEBE|nr:hypothetical protein CAEBREN_29183 [Caenorhabditis brenneri]
MSNQTDSTTVFETFLLYMEGFFIHRCGESVKQEEHDHLEASVELLRQQEKILEMMLRDCQAVLGLHFDDPIARTYNYVRKEDIRNTADPNTKSIIIKSESDSSSNFEVQVTDPSTSGSHDMIVKNKKGVKSHALLFSNEPPINVNIKKEIEDGEEVEDLSDYEADLEEARKDWNLDSHDLHNHR